MKSHWLYFKYVAKHKWYVFLACLRYGLIWRGIKHDWTKFLPSEWFPYVEYFYGAKRPDLGTTGYKHDLHQDDMAFNYAWNYHQKRNSHHWQYWILNYDSPQPQFNEQSYDGGQNHAIIADKDGNVAAVLYDYDSDYAPLKNPNMDAQKRLLEELKHTPIPLKMPVNDAKEMIADWMGAGKAQGKPKTWEWYAANKDKIQLHPETRVWVDAEMEKLKASYAIDVKGQKMGLIGASWFD